MHSLDADSAVLPYLGAEENLLSEEDMMRLEVVLEDPEMSGMASEEPACSDNQEKMVVNRPHQDKTE